MDKVKIWDNDLICPVCNVDKWHSSIIRVDIALLNDRQNFTQQIRYLFECETCGNSMLFGAVSKWEQDEDEVNIKIIPIDQA